MKRGFKIVAVLLQLTCLSSGLGADTLQDVDRAVSALGDFLLQTVPDEAESSMTILPFLSDEYGRVTLGDRLRDELELYLAAEYRRLRIIPQPEGGMTYTVAGELQSYPGKVRVICRITNPDGSLGGGTRIDMPSSAELLSLLEPSRLPRRDSQREEPISAEQWGTREVEDPFEPDDAPGFELQVPSFGVQSFGRVITPGDVDRYRFYKSGTGTVVLEAVTDIDLQLLLFREGENIPIEVSGNESAANVRIETSLGEGYYVVELLAYDFGIQGPYTFTVDLTGHSNDGFEPDNRYENAGVIYQGEPQQRVLLSGDEDWVELSFTVPGFYAVYTTGVQMKTRIEVYADPDRLLLADERGGEQGNASLVLFMGTRRLHARLSGEGTGSYTLAFEKIEPPQIFPSSGIEKIEAGEDPLAFQLRIIQSGRYIIRYRGDGGGVSSVSGQLFSLPAMRPAAVSEDSSSFLSAGDYLFVLRSDSVQPIRFCIAREEEGRACLEGIQE